MEEKQYFIFVRSLDLISMVNIFDQKYLFQFLHVLSYSSLFPWMVHHPLNSLKKTKKKKTNKTYKVYKQWKQTQTIIIKIKKTYLCRVNIAGDARV